ncbi:hypothetical protein D9613_003123 [Agrocybe pediades]|uniref:BRCT domain-containing protein n=1 Tax=Agrocybe pediades TaxID=84607 RepID=A0A8H4QP38_9AGAR|nr:hypothetical protein D9613_003123 [Agrocybe pediades]
MVMDALNESDLNETQATQLLQDLLDHDPNLSVMQNQSSILKSQVVLRVNETTSESIPSSRNDDSAPHYHLHGLASTQSQSNNQTVEEEEEMKESSQKENIGAVQTNKDLGKSHPSSSRSHSPHASVPSKSKKAGKSKGISKTTKKKSATTVPFKAPSKSDERDVNSGRPATRSSYKNSTKVTPSRYKVPARPVSPTSSIDSFARDPDENPKEKLIAGLKQLEIPLSDLGRDTPPRPMAKKQSYCREPSPTEKILAADSQPSVEDEDEAEEIENLSQQLDEAAQISQESAAEPANQPSLAQPRKQGYQSSASSDDSAPPASLSQGFSPVPRSAMTVQPLTRLQDHVGGVMNVSRFDVPPARWGTGVLPIGSSTTPQYPYRGLVNDFENPPFKQVQPFNTTTSTSGEATQPAYPTSSRDLATHSNFTNDTSIPQQPKQIQPSPFVSNTGEGETQPAFFPTSNFTSNYSHNFQQPKQVQPSPFASDTAGEETQPAFAGVERRHVPPPPIRPPVQVKQLPAPSKPSTRKANNLTKPVHAPSPTYPRPSDVIPDSEPMQPDEESNVHDERGSRRDPKACPVPSGKKVDKGKGRARDDDDDVEMGPPDGLADAAMIVDEDEEDGMEQKEEEEEEEDDIPLAASKSAQPAKRSRPPVDHGKKKEVAEGGANLKGAQKAQTAVAGPANKKVGATKRRSRRSIEHEVIPSSIPEEEASQRTQRVTRAAANTVKQEGKNAAPKKPPTSRQSTRSTTSKVSKRAASTDSHGINPSDVGMDEEEPRVVGLKRKRDVALEVGSKADSVLRRQPSRVVQSGGSTLTRPGSNGTRVLALWRAEANFYSGTVLTDEGNNRYTVLFDDNNEDTVELDHLRRLEIVPGDHVLFGPRVRGCEVISFDESQGFVSVKTGGSAGKEGNVTEVALKDIRISYQSVTEKWSNRRLDAHSITPAEGRATKKVRQSPSKQSLTSNKLLSGYGIVYTLSKNFQDYEAQKERVNDAANMAGFTIIDDITQVLCLEEQYFADNNRTVLKREDMKWIGHGIDRIFLIADTNNQKPKYLLALALGIPCLSHDWLHHSISKKTVLDWSSYLLPVGWSDSLGANPSQYINLNWGETFDHVEKITSNPFGIRLFAGKSFLCVGPCLVWHHSNNKCTITDRCIPQVIMAMGAERVECITSLEYASDDLATFDYILIKEKKDYLPQFRATTTVHWAWVKQSLFSSRLVELPTDWPRVVEQSQEA